MEEIKVEQKIEPIDISKFDEETKQIILHTSLGVRRRMEILNNCFNGLLEGTEQLEQEVLKVQEKYGLDYDVAREIVRMSYQTPYTIEYLVEVHRMTKNVAQSLKGIFEKMAQQADCLTGAFEQLFKEHESIEDLQKIFKREIDVSAQIANLEHRKKYCKNFLELKQIDRELNKLKYGRRKQ